MNIFKLENLLVTQKSVDFFPNGVTWKQSALLSVLSTFFVLL